MDLIELRRDSFPFADEDPISVAAVRINGTDLRALYATAREPVLVARYRERGFRKVFDFTLEEWLDPAQQIAFMYLDDVAPPSRHWLGDPAAGLTEDRRAAVLNCTCGCFPCGGATARIVIDDYTVSWSDFRQANSRDLIPIGTFRFSRPAYEAAVQSLRS